MAKEFAADVLICGTGAADLTLAIDLAWRGISFRLTEKMDDPFRGSHGKGIQLRTQEIFEDLGILDRASLPTRCSTGMKKNAGRSLPACSVSPRSCSKPERGEMGRGREVNQLDIGYPSHPLPEKSRNAPVAYLRATARPMRRSAVPPARRPGIRVFKGIPPC